MAGRERSEKPVEVRAFFLKASELGTVGFDASSLVLMAISNGEPGDGGVLERVVAELRFIDHRRVGIFLGGAVSCKFGVEEGAPVPSTPKAALSVCEPPRLRKLDMVRLKFEVEPKVDRLEGGAELASSWSAEEVGGVGVGVEGRAAVCGVFWGLWRVALGGGVAEVSTLRGGFGPSAVPWRVGGKAAAVWAEASCSWAVSRGWPSGFERAWKSCDWRPLTGVTGSFTASLSVSSPSSKMGCGRSVGYCAGDDDRLD